MTVNPSGWRPSTPANAQGEAQTVTGNRAAPEWAGQSISNAPTKLSPSLTDADGFTRSGGTFTVNGSGDIAGYGIASSRSLAKDGEASTRPMALLEAAAFQWVNPKAWVMAVTAMAVYTNPERPFLSVLIVVVAFALVNLPSVSCWAGFGMALRGFLADPARLKWFNIAMGVLLAVTLWPMLK